VTSKGRRDEGVVGVTEERNQMSNGNGIRCCLLQVCCRRGSSKYEAAVKKLFTDGGLDGTAAALASAALSGFDLVPAGTMDAYKDVIANEARKHPSDE
jgi:hypothetical protein